MKHKLPAPKAQPAPECNLTNAEPPPRLAVEHKEKGHAVLEHIPKRQKDGGAIAEYVSCKDRVPHRPMPIQRGEPRRTLV